MWKTMSAKSGQRDGTKPVAKAAREGTCKHKACKKNLKWMKAPSGGAVA